MGRAVLFGWMVLAAGCLASPPAALPTVTPIDGTHASGDVFEAVRALLADVPCEAPFDALTTTKNLKLLSNLTVNIDGRDFNHTELDVHGDLLLTTLGSGFNGIGLIDLHDPLRPVQRGAISGVGGLGVKFSPDGLTALVGNGPSISLVDIRDPDEPVQVGTWNFTEAPQPPRGAPLQEAHMLAVAEIESQQWVFVAPRSGTGVWILKLEGAPDARKLTFVTQTLPVQGGPLGPHDMVVQFDDTLKTHVLYTADGYHGWSVFDVSDPVNLELIGGIVRPETGYTHTVQAAQIGARRIVATAQEIGVNRLEVYDATDLRAPVLLGSWQATQRVVASQHNFNIAGGRLYLAHYDNGIFVFDLNTLGTTPVATPLEPVAHFGSAGAEADSPLYAGQFWDVVVRAGLVYGSSQKAPTKGISVIGDGCVIPGNDDLTSIG